SSDFLNQAESPIDICAIAESAGASYVARCSGLDRDLSEQIARALSHHGFAVLETLGMCTGRYTKNNRLTPGILETLKEEMPATPGVVRKNQRPEYGTRYRELSRKSSGSPAPLSIEKKIDLPGYRRQGVAILGSAGMRIVTAGDIVCHAGLAAGMNVSMKSDYDITVLRGPSVSEILISSGKIGYSGLESPTAICALSDEGVRRRSSVFAGLPPDTIVVREKTITVPETAATIIDVDFRECKIKKENWALAAVAVLAKKTNVLNGEMLRCALQSRFTGKAYQDAMALVTTILNDSRM
ncbi:MAG: 2-oxoacid:acceptor oxidoreductase family protein, partial [Desulfocapsaceae bacterium]|nr:2-oxoacid:acceptor oxidoreductase family protein [Desulfocapsaceae bacterium]